MCHAYSNAVACNAFIGRCNPGAKEVIASPEQRLMQDPTGKERDEQAQAPAQRAAPRAGRCGIPHQPACGTGLGGWQFQVNWRS